MLTIAEVSGLIAAAVMIVQYGLPAALVVILVKYVGIENTAVTWSVVNRTISTTIWPHLLRADAANTRQIPPRVQIPSWTATAGAALLVLASVITPLGLYDEIVPGESKLVEFQYVKDPGPWGRVTMPRPNSQFTRQCEVGTVINCPGQYQGVYMAETEPGVWRSIETDENSTINITIPENFTTMFTSATSDQGNTVSGLFDIQYRRWKFNQNGIINKGQPYVRGDSRDIGTLITQDRILLTEGLIVDMRDNPGIGFRNHTIPVGLEHGGTWNEDITWIEPVTKCADTNLSVELRIENTVDDFSDNNTFSIIDRGAFFGLDHTALESPAWIDNQTLDLFGRAHKAARMHNVLVASSLNISLPLDQDTKPLPKMLVKDTSSASPGMFSISSFDAIVLDQLRGVGGAPPSVPEYSGNTSIPFVNHYPDGFKKLLALNYSAIAQICRGYYEIGATDNDWRANNITYPAVQCGAVLGTPLQSPNEDISPSTYTGVETYQKNLYICASAVRASIKTVTFRYNGTGAQFGNLEAVHIADKVYADELSRPLWAAEHSYDRAMRFDPLWGIVDNRYHTMGYKEGFYTLRAEKLWLPTSPFLTGNFGESEGYDALAAASGFTRRLGNLYGGLSDLGGPDYSGQHDYTLLERYQRLSHNATVAAQIPSLKMTDGLAAGLVGTKTSISTRYVAWPASLAVDDTGSGIPRASVVEYRRVIRYDIRYAIPAIAMLALLLVALVWAAAILCSSRNIVQTLRNMYNQTSTGRLAVNLLRPGQGDAQQATREWVEQNGALALKFGQINGAKGDQFCAVVGGCDDAKAGSESLQRACDDDSAPQRPSRDVSSGEKKGGAEASTTVIPKQDSSGA
ncbi:hypothetical protein A1O7_05073 [Cladophialophora yegresii CBS 114405]|uniref:Uncharacterized protein n=1 Tax=Cladophialophora yegresii CBS 114405 TaxID=1182544 RepID=W9W7F5_9EURO|nr:uncharacterized protein A1O7_05073 [Cladophialophora yegresii CBS 114405]EXJ60920.1 hypothetical protein A1O7_05073 [Cladophialophora yegresii CBS 114405]